MYLVEREEIMELSERVRSAQSDIHEVLCSVEDSAISTDYLVRKLREALDDLSEVVLALKLPYENEDTLEGKVALIDAIGDGTSIPSQVKEVASTGEKVQRLQLAGLAKVLECWAVMLRNKYSGILHPVASYDGIA